MQLRKIMEILFKNGANEFTLDETSQMLEIHSKININDLRKNCDELAIKFHMLIEDRKLK